MSDQHRSDDDANFKAKVLEELEAEHAQRLSDFERMRTNARARAERRRAQNDQEQEAARKGKIRDEFYQEKGYMRYVDSRGKEKWLPPEEYAWRMKVRAHRRKQAPAGSFLANHRDLALYAALVIMGVGLGLYLLWFVASAE